MEMYTDLHFNTQKLNYNPVTTITQSNSSSMQNEPFDSLHSKLKSAISELCENSINKLFDELHEISQKDSMSKTEINDFLEEVVAKIMRLKPYDLEIFFLMTCAYTYVEKHRKTLFGNLLIKTINTVCDNSLAEELKEQRSLTAGENISTESDGYLSKVRLALQETTDLSCKKNILHQALLHESEKNLLTTDSNVLKLAYEYDDVESGIGDYITAVAIQMVGESQNYSLMGPIYDFAIKNKYVKDISCCMMIYYRIKNYALDENTIEGYIEAAEAFEFNRDNFCYSMILSVIKARKTEKFFSLLLLDKYEYLIPEIMQALASLVAKEKISFSEANDFLNKVTTNNFLLNDDKNMYYHQVFFLDKLANINQQIYSLFAEYTKNPR